MQVIGCLKTSYYNINPEDIKINMTRINAPHNTKNSPKKIINQIETAIEFYDSGKVPYTPE